MYENNYTAKGAELATQPQSATQSQMERLEKTLHHMAGRVQELKARLEPVLYPPPARPEGSEVTQDVGINASPAGIHLWRLTNMAASAISDVEDILNRLDV